MDMSMNLSFCTVKQRGCQGRRFHTCGSSPPLLVVNSTHCLFVKIRLLFISLRDSDCGYYTCQAFEDSQFISSRSVSVTAKLRDGNEGEHLQ